ncbi:MAG: integrase [Chloroflexi bacterium]|nr:MAG: integrase [Chloroflexota bacterium]
MSDKAMTPMSSADLVQGDISALAEEWMERWLKELDVRQTTKRAYRQAVIRFLEWTRGAGASTAVEFKEALQAEGLAAHTVGVYLTGLRRFCAWCVERGLLPYNPVENVKAPEKPRGHLRDAPTDDELRRVLAQVDRSTLAGMRNFAMLSLMYRCGLRTVEVVRADVDDVRPKDGEVVLWVQGKGRADKDEFVVLTGETYNAVMDYLTARQAQPGEPLFVGEGNRNRGRLTTRSVRRMVNRYFKAAGVWRPGLSAHSLRHYAATAALKAGAHPLQVQQMMRHRRFETTQAYIHDLGRIANAAERFVPQLGSA